MAKLLRIETEPPFEELSDDTQDIIRRDVLFMLKQHEDDWARVSKADYEEYQRELAASRETTNEPPSD